MAIKAKKSVNGTSHKTSTVQVKAEVREKSKPRPVIGREELEQRIRERAYHIYLNRGCSGGCEREDWLEAERQVKKELRIS